MRNSTIVDISVIIATYNRASDLAETLQSLSRLRAARSWELIVVDNNSTDDTRQVVDACAARFPVSLRYVFEARQGRSPALNAGIASAYGDIIVTTDDDVRVEADWLDRIADALDRPGCDYVGGRVLPIWGAPRPRWLPDRGGKHWAVIALLDYGDDPIEFGARAPLGVNMAFRRSAFDRAGVLDPGIGRKAGTLLGQEVREWCIRARVAGVRGFYVPAIAVRHVIPASRLRKHYFRRWFYWRGISRALLYERSGLDMEAPEQAAPNPGSVPRVFGVPRYLYRTAIRHARSWIAALVRRDPVASFDHELWLWFFAGIVRQRWTDRHGASSVTLLRRLTPVAHQLDHALAHLSPRRDVIVELRTPVYHAVLSPIARALSKQPGVNVWFTSEHPDRVRDLVPPERFLTHREAEWRRFDVYVNGDPWAPVQLRRCAHRVNFFHGVGGKYDLDNPKGLPLGFEHYDRVGFINRDRMQRYVDAGVVHPTQATLVGYPKLDTLANGEVDGPAVRKRYGLDDRPTVLYAPTYSDASSLHLAGVDIVRALDAAGFNVLVKLHDRSLDPDPRYNAGIDWRARFAELIAQSATGRVRYVEQPDACPLLAAADAMVTDHSSIGFEYLVLDRPLIVFDAPKLATAARVNPEKIALLRSAATVTATPDETARAAASAIANPTTLSAARRRIARDMFFEPGGATARATELIRELL